MAFPPRRGHPYHRAQKRGDAAFTQTKMTGASSSLHFYRGLAVERAWRIFSGGLRGPSGPAQISGLFQTITRIFFTRGEALKPPRSHLFLSSSHIMISLLSTTCFKIILRNGQIVLSNVHHFIWRVSRWPSDMEIIRLSGVQIWMHAMGITSSHLWAHWPVCATDFCYFTTHTLKFIVLHHVLRVQFSSRLKAKPGCLCLRCKLYINNVNIVSYRLKWKVHKAGMQQWSWATGAVIAVAVTTTKWCATILNL